MANEKHLNLLKQGFDTWNMWRKDNPKTKPDLYVANLSMMDLSFADLSGANLSRANLRETYLREANLRETDLSRADLSFGDLSGASISWAKLKKANLSWANLSEAHLSGANLGEVHLYGANLREAHLDGANLSGANLSYADLRGADLKGANFSEISSGYTSFADVDLREVKGLESVHHQGPSSIGVDTIYRSQGKIPDIFLRGIGVPENFIVYMHSLVGEAIQFYSCFISYSTKDQAFAERLHSDLQAKGVRVWFAPEDIKGGRKLHEQIPEAIRVYDKLLLVLSENSMKSEWVKTEIYHARQDEIRNNKRKLFPIGLVDFGIIRNWDAFDADTGKDMAREIREYFIPDFS